MGGRGQEEKQPNHPMGNNRRLDAHDHAKMCHIVHPDILEQVVLITNTWTNLHTSFLNLKAHNSGAAAKPKDMHVD